MHRLRNSTSFRRPFEVPNTDPRDEFDGLTFGKVPAIQDRVKSDSVMKLCQDGEWQQRVIFLTSEELVIALLESNDVSDKIPLVTFV